MGNSLPTIRYLMLVQRRLTAFVGRLLADAGHLGALHKHDLLDAAPDRKITTRCVPCGGLDNAVSNTRQRLSVSSLTSVYFTKVRCFFSILMRINAALAEAGSESAAARGDFRCCDSNRVKYLVSETS